MIYDETYNASMHPRFGICWMNLIMGLIRVWGSDYLRMSFLEKWQLANEFSVCKVNCDGNTLLSAKQELKVSLFFKKSTIVRKHCSCKLNIVSSVSKSKESPRWVYEKGQSARIFTPRITDKNNHVISWNKDLLS